MRFLVLIFFLPIISVSQPSLTLTIDTEFIDFSKINFIPDTIWIEGGTRKFLQLKNLNGNPEKKTVIINKGKVIISNDDFHYAFRINNFTNFKLTGTGPSDTLYGIKIASSGSNGLIIDGTSTDFEVDHIEITSCEFAGIMAKADPSCDNSKNRDTFYQKNIRIHNNYIHDVKGEGMYIGNSFYNGYSRNKDCPGDTLYPHEIKNLKVFSNKIHKTGWDGLQIGCATDNIEVFENSIIDFGRHKKKNQTSGIQIGEGTTGVYYNNYIEKGTGNGITILGLGNTIVYNNYISAVDGSGIFCDDRHTPEGNYVAILNNSISYFGENGLRWYNEYTKNVFINNQIICNKPFQKAFHYLNEKVKREVKNNYIIYSAEKKKPGKEIKYPQPGTPLYYSAINIKQYILFPLPYNPHIGCYFNADQK